MDQICGRLIPLLCKLPAQQVVSIGIDVSEQFGPRELSQIHAPKFAGP